MSRPIKQGLDYFPMDVNIDEKIELIEAKYGLVGFGIIIKLYQRIYKEAYYINWNEETLLLFGKRINVDINTVNAVINDCFRYHLFDENLYNLYKILTSSGIQKRYFSAIERRKIVNLNKNYIIVDINLINVDINWIDDDVSTQSKVKESKVKEIYKEKNLKPDILKIEDVPKNLFGETEELEIIKENRKLEKIKNIYNKLNLPKIREFSNERKALLKARIDQYNFDDVLEALQKVEVSNFLNGENDRGWQASFNWIFKKSNFGRILEGEFDNRKGTTKGGNSMGTEVLKGKKIENEFSRTAINSK